MSVKVDTTYSAMDIAKYAVNRRYKAGKPISNLQLQKILYFLQVVYASNNQALLFSDNFEAWPYGPEIRDVYAEFSDCGSFPIQCEYPNKIDEGLQPFLNVGVDTLADKSPWDLVRISHAEGSPWDYVYNVLNKHKGIISNELLLEFATGGKI